MKIIKTPSVYIVGRQTCDDAQIQKFLNDHNVSWQSDTDVGAEYLSEMAGRVCYMSFAKPRPGGNQAYLKHILEVGHGSVLEHGVFNLLITGISRSLTHEFVRHRSGFGYSQLSQRYVDESVAEYVVPQIIAEDPALYEIWLKTVNVAHEGYCKLVDMLNSKLMPTNDKEDNAESRTARRKQARQAARSVLPNATETKLFVTANVRALRHFIEMRGSIHADDEIRELAVCILGVMKQEAPNLFSDYQFVDNGSGKLSVVTAYRKV